MVAFPSHPPERRCGCTIRVCMTAIFVKPQGYVENAALPPRTMSHKCGGVRNRSSGSSFGDRSARRPVGSARCTPVPVPPPARGDQGDHQPPGRHPARCRRLRTLKTRLKRLAQFARRSPDRTQRRSRPEAGVLLRRRVPDRAGPDARRSPDDAGCTRRVTGPAAIVKSQSALTGLGRGCVRRACRTC